MTGFQFLDLTAGKAGSIPDHLLRSGRRIALIVCCRAGDIAVSVQLAFPILPVAVQGHSGCGSVQVGDPLAAGGRSVPAQEPVAGFGRRGPDAVRYRGIITLDPNQIDAVFHIIVEHHIIVVAGHALAVDAIEVHVGLTQAPVHQAGYDGLLIAAAGGAPPGNGKDKVISGGAADDGTAEHRIIVHPVGAEIICKGYQCVKLLLFQRQLVLIGKVIDILFKLRKGLAQQCVSLSFCDAIGILPRAAGSTVAHGPLADILIGLRREPFDLLDKRDTVFTGLHVGSCVDIARAYRNQAQQNHGRQQKTNRPLFHGSCSFYD